MSIIHVREKKEGSVYYTRPKEERGECLLYTSERRTRGVFIIHVRKKNEESMYYTRPKEVSINIQITGELIE